MSPFLASRDLALTRPDVDLQSGFRAIMADETKSVRTVLTFDGNLAPIIEQEQVFDFPIPSHELFAG